MYIQQFRYLKGGGGGVIPKYNALPIGLFLIEISFFQEMK
jgi:hypothetical protein